MYKNKIAFLMACVLLASCGPRAPKTYPAAGRTDVCDVFYGDTVEDPYRWMENDTSAEVASWVREENALTRSYLDAIPFRTALKERLTDLYNYEKAGAPMKRNGKYYFFRNDGLQNQSVLYRADSLSDRKGTVLLDPNTFSDEGTVALTGVYFSKDGKYMAYTISRNGSDWSEIFVMDPATGEMLTDHIEWCKFSGAEWYGDGFFYSAYGIPEEGKEFTAINEGHKVYYHKLGTPQSEDKVFYENKDYPKRFYTVTVSDDERMLFLYSDGMGSGNLLSVMDLNHKEKGFVPMVDDYNNWYYLIATDGGKIYLYTNYGAPRYRVMEASLSAPSVKNWKEVVPEQEWVLSSASILDGRLFLVYDKDVANHVYVAGLDGKGMKEITLPGAGSVSLSGSKDSDEIFYTFTSFTVPGAIYRYDPQTDSSSLYHSPEIDFDGSLYETKQVFFTSKDGTPVPMYLVYRKGLELDGNNPVIMTGYGGFGISLYPSFSTNYIPFIENGGVYVQVNMRGGNEYGQAWHEAGTKLNKQNVFDDFISAAEYLIANGYTQKRMIGIMGGSNGGLLIGACVNQAPELFGAAVPRVGVMDMLRYHLFTIGWNWAPDYGTVDDSEEMFRYLRGYSPLHNISNDGTEYPAILVTTADHDDRVVPAHSFKYAAQLQWSDTGGAPKLIRIDSNAGHGGGKPVSKTIDEMADIYSFMMYNIGMSPKF